jgi:hypothetical protein
VGIVLSFQPEDDSPVQDLPWLVTFQPGEGEDWDSFSCGPYRREHAEARADAVAMPVDGVVAIVEPLLAALDAETVIAEIQRRRDEAAELEEAEEAEGEDEPDDEELEEDELPLPAPADVRGGMEAVMRQLLIHTETAK